LYRLNAEVLWTKQIIKKIKWQKMNIINLHMVKMDDNNGDPAIAG